MFLRIHEQDNVAVALQDLVAGSVHNANGISLDLRQPIQAGHKFAVSGITKGTMVTKYGWPIGHALADIQAGEWVHTHNVATNLEGKLEYEYNPTAQTEARLAATRTFKGYRRNDGSVGVRNEVWVIPTVGCINQTAEIIAQQAGSALQTEGSIDGVYAFKHPYGCSQLGDDLQHTQQLLAALAKHPNAGGVLIIGLGCEHNRVEDMKRTLGTWDSDRIRFLVAQDCDDEIAIGTELAVELGVQAGRAQREDTPLSALRLGLKCGGSDGFSGITANPLVGQVSDVIVAQGGISVLTEVPEMFGAEQILMNRAVDRQVFTQTVELINDFKAYFLEHKQPVYENPSPGNKDGGITTLEDKSLGCTQKGGTSPVVDVLAYGERASKPGLNLLQSPGNDLTATTALAAAGCQIIFFTTGRGTPYGTCVPTLKIATNSQLFAKKPHWMDFDAGTLLSGETMAEATERLVEDLIQVASGERHTHNERIGFRDITIWKQGVTV